MLGQSASGPNHTFPRQVYLFKSGFKSSTQCTSFHQYSDIHQYSDMLTNQQFGEIMAIENNALAIQ